MVHCNFEKGLKINIFKILFGRKRDWVTQCMLLTIVDDILVERQFDVNAQGNRLLLIRLLGIKELLCLDVHGNLCLALGEDVAWTNTPRRRLRLTTKGEF